MNLTNLSLFAVGGVLIYSAVKGYNPVSVVRYGLGGPKPSALSAPQAQPDFKVAPPTNPNEVPNPDGNLDPDAGAGTLKNNGSTAGWYGGNPTIDPPMTGTGV